MTIPPDSPTGDDVSTPYLGGDAAEATDSPTLLAGRTLGRYQVLGKIGTGGMGVVYGAYDPVLDRKIALKVLRRPSGEPLHRAEQRRRLLREAQALARLAHPHVISVYDVGELGGTLFLAMEYVPGQDLRSWLQGAERSEREILELFLQAGRGLAAAHQAGLVHRDFKPGNVMVRPDGRAVVLDFGLARLEVPKARDDIMSLEELGAVSPGEAPAGELTLPGAVLGTPAFMAPEQRLGRPASPAADQYSFCASLYHALFGRRPPREETLSGAAEGDGREGSPPPSPRVSSRTLEVLRRGLARKPEDRYPSLQRLLRDLEAGLRRKGRTWRWLAAGLLALLSATAVYSSLRPAARLCSGAPDLLAPVWNQQRRQQLTASLAGTGVPYGRAAAVTAGDSLDAYGRAWVDLHTEVCRATRLRGEQSEELLDRRMACLDQRLAELGALADVLIGQPRETVRRAAQAAHALTPLTGCSDLSALTSSMALPSEEGARGRVEALRRRLALAKAHQDAGRMDSAQTVISALDREAEDLGYWPLTAEVLLRKGHLLSARGEAEEAAQVLNSALLAAGAGRHDRAAAEAFVRLVRVAGYQQGDLEGSRRFAAQAQALVRQLGDGRYLEALLADYLGILSTQNGDFDRAETEHRRALALRQAGFPHDASSLAVSLIRLSNVLIEQGEFSEAQEHLERARRLQVETLGPQHPSFASTLDRLGTVAFRRGDYGRARELHRRSLEIKRRTLGDEHPKVAITLVHLGSTESSDRHHELALEHYREALGVYEKSLGREHPHVALILSNIAAVLLDLDGRGAEAAGFLEEALTIQERVYGGDHPWVATTLFNLGAALQQLGRFTEALEHQQRALAIWTRAHGDGHYLIAHGLYGLGRAYQGLRDPERARQVLERALDISATAEVDPEIVADIRFRLAQVLSAGGDRRRALSLAREARARLLEAPQRYREEIEEIEGWLAEREAS